MPVRLDQPPEEATSALIEGMRRLVESPNRSVAFAAMEPEKVTLPKPLPLYRSTLDAAAEGRVLEDAQASGWQYLVLENEKPTALAEVEVTAQGAHEFSNLARSSFSRETVPCLELAMSVGEQMSEELSLRMLRVPSVYTVALWLHGETQDRVIPIPPTHRLLMPFQIYTGQDFTEQIRIAALRQRDQHSEP